MRAAYLNSLELQKAVPKLAYAESCGILGIFAPPLIFLPVFGPGLLLNK
jgi:hypothetical protein